MITLAQPLKIGSVTLKNRLILAPMAGYTDAAMRLLCAKSGAGLTVTEMVSAKGLVYSPDKCAPLLIRTEVESVCAVQLFGHEPEFFEKALRMSELDGFDIIDINMGCPVPKIVNNGEGSALIKQPKLAESIVKAAVAAAGGRPVTVKTRVGFDENEDCSVEFCSRMADAGAAAITLHSRTRAQGYAGSADWDKIERLKGFLSVPVIGSGDINGENASKLIKRADGLMIGRAAVGDTDLFAQILGYQKPKVTAIEHFDLMVKYYGERYATVNFRHHFGGYLRGRNGQRDTKLALYNAKSVEEIREILANI